MRGAALPALALAVVAAAGCGGRALGTGGTPASPDATSPGADAARQGVVDAMDTGTPGDAGDLAAPDATSTQMHGDAGDGGTPDASDAMAPFFCDPAPESGAAPRGDAAVPLYHRAAPACCPSQRDPGPSGQPGFQASPLSPDAGGCTSDSDCNAGVNGRCFPFEGLNGLGGCSYDECFTDPTCGSRTPCVCRSSYDGDRGADNGANVCVPGGNCAVDSDCGPGGYCSPSQGDWCYDDSRYYCHTALDTCTNDKECPPAAPSCDDAGVCGCQTYSVCAYDTQALHWACTQGTCCPP